MYGAKIKISVQRGFKMRQIKLDTNQKRIKALVEHEKDLLEIEISEKQQIKGIFERLAQRIFLYKHINRPKKSYRRS